ncbi:hypothetical protein LOZ80_00330 [Paenibacillus sp. HWE-109]|uniref:hypothetical protein n=1 Tax=Paenibacillus sp. HWE-109 TaxID=1306526 RepID=UPI001EDDC711|nr:hypothetical protein [Paenibacillus sp. HWE-109]UKS27436.1 hypothetical protein LOZ80_00330 [Paenibacillus sp. HWE-109]
MVTFFLLARQDKGTTAVELSQIIQVTYKTAWSILHKIRSMIHKSNNQSPLTGSISINSAVYGRPFNPSVYKHPREHLLLIAASPNYTEETTTFLKIKHVIPDNPTSRHITRSAIINFQTQHIDSSAQNISITTGLYTPKRLRPLLSIAKQASQWINTTFHGLGATHLQFYLEEFILRFSLFSKNISLFPRLVKLCFSIYP